MLSLCLFAFCFACGGADDNDDSAEITGDDDTGAENDEMEANDFGPRFCKVDEEKVEDVLAGMTLREKVAQLYFVGMQLTPWFDLPETQALVRDLGVGGAYIQAVIGVGFSTEWSVANINRLQSMALSRENPIPLIITIDDEGGIPQALNAMMGGTDEPGNMGLGATFDPDATYASHRTIGQELRALGINASCGPVAELMNRHDEYSMYTRCFGESSEEVSQHVAQAVRGLQGRLVMATAKHFPSHATAPGDEHFMLPVNDADEETVRREYLPPFIAAIEAGTDAIMTTHAVYRAWEDTLPSTFSRRIVTDLLRDELAFDGLIMTDDLNMGSITLTEWDEAPDVLAFAAGVDVILDCFGNGESMFGYANGNLAWPYRVAEQVDTVVAAVESGRLNEASIDESVRRVLRTKMKYCLFENPFPDKNEAKRVVGSQDHAAESRRLHERAITLVRDDAHLLPLPDDGSARVHVVCPAFAQLEMYPDGAWGNIASTDLLQEMKRLAPDTTGDVFLVSPWPLNADRIVERAEESDADVLVIGTYNAASYESQIDLVRRLLDLDKPTVVAALAMPYDLVAFPDAPTYIVTYSNRDMALATLARILLGRSEAEGRLPVSIPGLYDIGWSVGYAP
ncbi:MAG: glycoside hydrolase family 3 N-terminal domain-containing protein [Candidatus Lernaella stagnicola]|nr:glycoside hydrolase family 3 N-terminal domain-containing protein [Candidatus Lernaella stagnicola]